MWVLQRCISCGLQFGPDNNFMDGNEQGFTNHFINYNTVLSERHSYDYYQPRRNFYLTTPSRPQPVVPLKRFQEYFGKVKPSLYHQLRNIFLNSTLEERSLGTSPQQPRCLIQGTTMTSRAYQIRKKAKRQDNHFTIEPLNAKDFHRKARLNRIIKLKDSLADDSQDEDLAHLLKESAEPPKESADPAKEIKQSSGHSNKHRSIAQSGRDTRSIVKNSLLDLLNPNNSKEKVTVGDIQSAVCLLHSIKITVSHNLSYFNIYIEDGNNSELLKMLVRRRNGWRVVELPDNANLIWTQFYRKSILSKRLHKRDKTEKDEELPRTSKSLPYRTHRPEKQPNRLEKQPQLHKNNEESYLSDLKKLVPPKQVCELSDIQVASERQVLQLWVGQNLLVHNHFPQNRCISDKKNLLSNMKQYFAVQQRDLLEVMPETYELRFITDEPVGRVGEGEQDLYWIIKPGENSNRGRGITVTKQGAATMQQLRRRMGEGEQAKASSLILQRYITPLLYNKRKFDIRSYMLVTLINRQLRLYSYEDCYIRTSSKPFDMSSPSRLVHLTNDAIQAQSACYGRYEEGNKLSEPLFEKYIDEEYRRSGKGRSIWKHLRTQMDNRYIDVLQSSWKKLTSRCLSPHSDSTFYFEVFGMDFMIDRDFKLWLIEVNTNPAITHDCSKVLNQLIPAMLDNLLVLAVEPVMPPLRPNLAPFDNRFRAIHKIDIQ